VTRATSSPRFESAITLADGRQLAYAEWGDPRGKPVVFIPICHWAEMLAAFD
jgi:hypothetical protein